MDGPALNVYLRLSEDEKKNAEEIKTALRTEFVPAHRDRVVALEKLSNRKLLKDESPYTYAYALMELTKLAYSTLPANSQDVIARDHFMRGQSRDVQVTLKSLPEFGTKAAMELAKEVVRFQTAGIPINNFTPVKCEVDYVNVNTNVHDKDSKLADSIVEKVVAKFSGVNAEYEGDNAVNYVRNYTQRGRRGYYRGPNYKGNNGNNYNGNSYRGKRTHHESPSRNSFNCRSCRSPAHGYSKCPTRFCQACEQPGHDAWNRDCPNY